MPRKLFLLVCLLFLIAVEGSSAQLGRQNTWSARSSTGRALMGTWTAVGDPANGTVAGTWTLINAQGTTLARGGWSAAKSRAGWTGAWRAAVSDRKAEYSGTWSAGVDLEANAPFARLFEQAVQAAVSGTWRAGRQSGPWSIKAVK